MTKKLAETLGIPSLNEILQDIDEDEADLMEEEFPTTSQELITHNELSEVGFSKSMEKIHDEVLDHAQKIAELGYDMDPARAPRVFEVAAQYYKAAIDAKVAKRDAQLKLFKLIQDQKKIELAEKKFNLEAGNLESDDADVIIFEDRNALLARLKEDTPED